MLNVIKEDCVGCLEWSEFIRQIHEFVQVDSSWSISKVHVRILKIITFFLTFTRLILISITLKGTRSR